MHSTKALCRTTIGLIIIERLGCTQNKTLLKDPELMAEKPMIAEVLGGMEVVTGDAVGCSGCNSLVLCSPSS